MRILAQFDEIPELKQKMLFRVVRQVDETTYELEQADIIGNPRYSIWIE